MRTLKPADIVHLLAIATIIASLMSLPGCASPPARNTDAPPPTSIPPYEQLRHSEQNRIGRLQELASFGVIELRWEDESGSHFEQGDLELALVLPNRSALRIKKFGEDYMWLGSAGEDYWLFDNRDDDDRVLYLGDTSDQQRQSATIAGVFHPLVLLDLVGLTMIDDTPADVTYDSDEHAFVVQSNGRGGPMVVSFDPDTLRPIRIDAVNQAGEILATSRLSRFERVEIDGAPPGGWPTLALSVRVTDPQGAGEASITLDQTRGYLDPVKKERYFDLDLLRQGHRPHRESGTLSP